MDIQTDMDIQAAAAGFSLAEVPASLKACVVRWWERAAEHPAFLEAHAAAAPGLRAELPRVLACSEFVAAALLREPAALTWLETHEEPAAAGDSNRDFEARIAALDDEAAAMAVLRAWRRRELLRIAWRDLAGRASVPETLQALSQFADGCIRAAAASAQLQLEAVYGLPRTAAGDPVPFIVLGMGKLGGRELNFSSDIDLILLFGQDGKTDGARSIDTEEYFQRLGRRFVALLGARTEDGFVFRVDVRLRPFGASGPLVWSIAALEEYLQQHGRDWERYAWIKARPIVGADAYAATYRGIVRPFVYRRYLDFGVFESLRDMKALIAREVARRDLERDLKLGKGGIREIEFIAQSFQLVRGGNDLRLQNGSLLAVLPVLAGSKLLPKPVVSDLTDAYLVLRKAENALQMIRDEQTHGLPENDADRARLSLCLQLPEWRDTLAYVDAARGCAAAVFETLVFGGPSAQRVEVEGGLDWLASESLDVSDELGQKGLPAAEIPAVARTLEAYRNSAAYRKLDENGRRRVHVILGRVLRAAAALDQPATICERVLRILAAIGTRSSYLALLKEQPPALTRLIDICAISGFLARQIAEFPLLLDELIDPKAFEELPSRAGLARELQARTERLPADDPERQVEALRQFQKAAVFAVALADLTGRLPLMSVSDRLTDIAELIVECCMSLAWEQVTATLGVPHCGSEPDALRVAHVAVAGYGKLGGLELGYGSDLDLVFLHDSAGEIQQTLGARCVDNAVFFLRLGQRIVHLLTMHSAAGRLYEVDMRLRPNGKGGFLITGIDAFERYQHDDAWTWEHQALLRARAVAGEATLRARFEAARRRALTIDVRRTNLRSDVMEMRARMRRELSLAGPGQFDIKQGSGGIADIEFLVQYWVLGSAHRYPELITFTDNIRQLEALARFGVIDAATAQWLTEAYRGYRAVLHHLSLESANERVVDAAPYADKRERVREIWDNTFKEPESS
jgi:glutamate-ammonia-ligase adenylyltransferase